MTLAGFLLLTAAGALTPGDRPGVHPGNEPGAAFVHSIAQVNDSRSHGALGDSLLSLNEAIQLFNRTITVAQLSISELNQLSGFGADIAWAAIDASAVPTIVVERDFDIITDLPHGLLIEGFNGDAVIDFATNNVQNGFQSVCNFNNYRNLVLVGGNFGVDLQQTDASFGGCVVENVVFDGQAQFGFRATGMSAAGYSRVLFGDCRFVNSPAGIVFTDVVAARQTTLAVFDSRFETVADGVVCSLGDLGQATLQFDRLDMDASGFGVRVRRPGGGTRPVVLQASFVRATAADCFVYEGLPGVSSTLQLRMLDLHALSGKALQLGATGAPLSGFVQDCTLHGDVSVRTGGNQAALELQNLRAANGAVTLETDAAQPLVVLQSRFDGCAITAAGATGLVDISSSCLVGGSAVAAGGAALSIDASYSTATAGAGASVTNPLPSAQLGAMHLNAPPPSLGGSIQLQMDLPSGLVGLFAIGTRSDPVFEFSPTIRAYVSLTNVATVPGLYRLQQGVQIPVPNNLALLQTEWVCQAIVLPDPGKQAPDLQTPPGARFVLR